MVTLRTLQQEKRAAILTLGRKHGARSIRVFGSVARGDSRETSDVDFLVEFEEDRTLFDLIDLRLDLRDLLGVEVDIVTPNSLRSLRDGVLAEAKAIYRMPGCRIDRRKRLSHKVAGPSTAGRQPPYSQVLKRRLKSGRTCPPLP